MGPQEKSPDWEKLLAAERHIQHLIPGTTLVGRTAAAIHAQHRISMDGDHVLDDLRDRFDEVLAVLEAVSGWQTEREYVVERGRRWASVAARIALEEKQ